MKKVGRVIRESLVNNLKSGLDSPNTFVVTYTKISGEQMSSFRKNFKKAGAKVYVSKNSLAKLALKEINQEKFSDRLKGQTAFICSEADSVELSKVLTSFIKSTEGILIQGGMLEGEVVEKVDVERLSELPSKDVLRANLLRTMLAPLTRLAYVLNGKSQDLLSILKQLSEKKGGK